jgi:hypothetical protein
LEHWLLHDRTVEELLGPSLHPDLAAKGVTMLVFLAHRRKLTEAHVEVMWAACRGAHEATMRVLHQLLLVLLPVLDLPLRGYLFSLICSFAPRDCSEQLLLLIKAFAVESARASKEEQRGGGGRGRSAGLLLLY